MGRHKGDQSGISSVAELDHHIRLIGRLDIAIDDNHNNLDVQIQQVKKEFLAREEMLRAQRTVLLSSVQAYVHENKDKVLQGKKSRQLNFGKVGWRKLPDRIELPDKGSNAMQALIEHIETQQDLNPETFGAVQIRTERWVERGQVKALADEDLGLIGLTRVKGPDEIFVQPDRVKVAEMDGGGLSADDTDDADGSPLTLPSPARGEGKRGGQAPGDRPEREQQWHTKV
jgi:phage host-nuclease inhibitor protein Gam